MMAVLVSIIILILLSVKSITNLPQPPVGVEWVQAVYNCSYFNINLLTWHLKFCILAAVMLWAALNELSPRNRLRPLILTYGPVFLTYSPIFCWRSDNFLPGAGPVAVQGFLLLPHVTCEIPETYYVFVMDVLPTGNRSFWCSAWCLCFTSGPYLLIYFMTSLPILIFSHSKFSLFPTSPVWFAQLVACIWFLGHREWTGSGWMPPSSGGMYL